MIQETQTVIVYSSQAEMVIDQALLTGEFFAVFSGMVTGGLAFILTQMVLRPQVPMPSWYRPKTRRPSNEVIGLIVGAVVWVTWTWWLMGKLA